MVTGGYIVHRCLKCKTGLLVGLGAGMLFGRPKIIPELNWFDLEAQWSRELKSSKMRDDDMAELGFMLLSMYGFVHGYRRLNAETNPQGDVTPAQQFYLSALRTMTVNYFIGTSNSSSDVNLRDILQKHGLAHLQDPIDRLLKTPLGPTTYEGILKRIRNKYLTHELFQVEPLRRIHIDFDLRKSENWVIYHSIEQSLFYETVKLFYELRGRFPGAWLRAEDLKS